MPALRVKIIVLYLPGAVGSGLMSFVSSVQDSSIWYICQLASPLSELGPVKAVVDKAYPVTI